MIKAVALVIRKWRELRMNLDAVELRSLEHVERYYFLQPPPNSLAGPANVFPLGYAAYFESACERRLKTVASQQKE